jgi:hypothetical protein
VNFREITFPPVLNHAGESTQAVARSRMTFVYEFALLGYGLNFRGQSPSVARHWRRVIGSVGADAPVGCLRPPVLRAPNLTR